MTTYSSTVGNKGPLYSGFFLGWGGSSMWLLSDKNESNLLRYTKSTVTYQFDPVVCWVFSLLQSLSVQVFGTHCVSYSTFPVWPEHSLSLFEPRILQRKPLLRLEDRRAMRGGSSSSQSGFG